MNLADLAQIHVDAVARYAQIFPVQSEAEGRACSWWLWASRNLPRQLYEEVRKKRWKDASTHEKRTAKAHVPEK